jgi:hypothetical protein
LKIDREFDYENLDTKFVFFNSLLFSYEYLDLPLIIIQIQMLKFDFGYDFLLWIWLSLRGCIMVCDGFRNIWTEYLGFYSNYLNSGLTKVKPQFWIKKLGHVLFRLKLLAHKVLTLKANYFFSSF